MKYLFFEEKGRVKKNVANVIREVDENLGNIWEQIWGIHKKINQISEYLGIEEGMKKKSDKEKNDQI